jgi:hypothetical protein
VVRRGAACAAGLALLVTFASFGVVRPARAEDVAVLAARGSEEVDAPTRARALSVLVAALRESGQRVVPPAEVARRLTARGEAACAALECAARMSAALDLAEVVELTLWSDGRGALREVVVAISRRGDAERAGTASVGRAGLDAALRAALALARAGGGRRAGVRVRVTVAPDGAALTLDGRPLGRAPWEGVLPAGRHTIVAGHAGHDAARRVVELVDAPVTVALRLAPESGASAAHGSQGDENNRESGVVSPAAVAAAAVSSSAEAGPRGASASSAAAPGTRPLLGPLLLGAVGLALLSVDLGALVVLGSEPAPGFARSLDPAPFVLYGALGLGAVIGAVLWYLLGDEPPPAPRLARGSGLPLDF